MKSPENGNKSRLGRCFAPKKLGIFVWPAKLSTGFMKFNQTMQRDIRPIPGLHDGEKPKNITFSASLQNFPLKHF